MTTLKYQIAQESSFGWIPGSGRQSKSDYPWVTTPAPYLVAPPNMRGGYLILPYFAGASSRRDRQTTPSWLLQSLSAVCRRRLPLR
jgi:hypothetical protein